MNVAKIIKLFYLGYSVFIILVINTTSITFIDVLPSIILLWITYFFYIAGFYINVKRKELTNTQMHSQSNRSWLLNKSKISLMVILLITIFSSIASVKYYTGQTPIGVIRSLINNVSLYYQYQFHFKEQGIATFSITKIPYILMLFFVKYIFYYVFITYLIIKDKTDMFEKIFIILIGLSFAYVGIARGTNFEFFEIVMMVIFIILNRSKTRKKIKVKPLIGIGLIIASMIFIFFSVISTRGVQFNYYISRDVYYDSEALISSKLPLLSLVIITLYDYLGFGFFYMSNFISKLWFRSPSDFLAGMVPNGFIAMRNSSIQQIMLSIVEKGVRWEPDMIGIINSFGFIGLLLLVFSLGIFSRVMINRRMNNGMSLLTNYIILMQMVSLPVGNFVIVSSASKLIILTISVYWVNKFITKIKISRW